jgi:hypothetical protein
MKSHVVMFSSGAGSWAAARRVADQHGTENLALLFTDVKGNNPSPHAGEDEDNYRFLLEAAADIFAVSLPSLEPTAGDVAFAEWASTDPDARMRLARWQRRDLVVRQHLSRLVILNEGRDIWQVFHDEHMLGNTRVAPCSKQLKQRIARHWIEKHYPDPEQVTLHIGIDWTEIHRVQPNRHGWSPYRVEAPLTEPPYVDKRQVLDELRRRGIRPPRLYDLGFAHANCGGFCVRMGHGQAKQLLTLMPDRYAYHEQREQEFRDKFGRDVSFLRDRTGGELVPLTLRTFRERVEDGAQPDLFDIGGCGCFVDFEGTA